MHKSKPKWQRLPGHRNLKGRAGHTATLVGKDIYILGGRNGNEFFNDMWIFDTEAERWKLQQSNAPFSPRAYHTCTLLNDQELWVIGGSDPKQMFADVYVFDVVSSKWSNPNTSTMEPRGTHAAVLHPMIKNAILIYGGYGGRKSCWMNDLIIFHTDTLQWEDLRPEGDRPVGRGYHTLTTFGNFCALYGGKAEGGIINEDKLSIYNAQTNRWSMVQVRGELPTPRSNHASAFTANGMIVIHGGRHGSLRLSDWYVMQVPSGLANEGNLDLRWHRVEKSESPTITKRSLGKRSLDAFERDSPSGRSAHSLISHGQALYIFGGYGGGGLTFADLFVLRKLPNIPGISDMDLKKQKLELTMELDESHEERGGIKSDNFKGCGWKSVKQLKPHHGKQVHTPSVTLHLQANQINSNIDAADSSKEKHDEQLETKSTEVMERNELKALSSFREHSLSMLILERDGLKGDVRLLQERVETLQATINSKMSEELDYQRKSLQQEQELQRLQKEQLQLQLTNKEIEKEKSEETKKVDFLKQENISLKSNLENLRSHESKKVHRLEQENISLKADLEILKNTLGDSENARGIGTLKINELEKKLQDAIKSFEASKAIVVEVSNERDKYKSCVQALEAELQKQMDALRQISSRFEGEKSFLLKMQRTGKFRKKGHYRQAAAGAGSFEGICPLH
ncbi:hypothetical protein KP509_12G021800 [Ceratopteris richardii]|uniref:Attractin/MKLN-like beta-propeller domain-containing protein n=1 Tax=Ceratopteris richardii TaxID=49495 RepID=A0A8T2TLX5_CERRI|nr:hypothetical protein KP509_12G021800 [Ceratopteris richardii]